MCLPISRLFWVSSLAYPNLLRTKGYVVVVVVVVLTSFHATCETYYKKHMKHYNATFKTSHMQHGHATIETYNALMKQYLMIMLHDAHDQCFNCFLTFGMLQ
jgi:hypothetical protein